MKNLTLDEVIAALRTLAQQVDEDCPPEYRTQHLCDALEDAYTTVLVYYQTQPNTTKNQNT